MGAVGVVANYGKWWFSGRKHYKPVLTQIPLVTAGSLAMLPNTHCEGQNFIPVDVLNFERNPDLLDKVQAFIKTIAFDTRWEDVDDKNSTLIQQKYPYDAEQFITRIQQIEWVEGEKKLILNYFLPKNICYKEEIFIQGENKNYWQAKLTFPLTSTEKKAYKQASLRWHPDRCTAKNQTVCSAKFNHLQDHYQTIWETEQQHIPIHSLQDLDRAAIFNTPGGWKLEPQIDKTKIFINTLFQNQAMFCNAICSHLTHAVPNLILPNDWAALLFASTVKFLETFSTLSFDIKNWIPELNQSLCLTLKHLILQQLKHDYPNLTEHQIKRTEEYLEKCKLCEHLSKLFAYFFGYVFSVFEILACFSVGNCYSGIEKTLLLTSHFLGGQFTSYCLKSALSCLTSQELEELKNSGISGLCKETISTWQKITYAMMGIDPYVKSSKIPKKPIIEPMVELSTENADILTMIPLNSTLMTTDLAKKMSNLNLKSNVNPTQMLKKR